MSGTSFIIVGFSFATLNGCKWVSVFSAQCTGPLNLNVPYSGAAPTTLGLIIGGTVLLALGGVYEVRTSREALFPPQLFKDVSCGSVTSPFRQTRHSQMTHSCNPHRGVSTQFLFYYWNLLYRHLFPGEILTNPEMRSCQLGRLTFCPLY